MTQAPNMLMLGSAGRNVGKTEFACELIQREAAVRNVVGIKITTISERGGACPRGGKGCGVCGSLEAPYEVIEETEQDHGKDTGRMKAAGARQVLWLRVLKDRLSDGVEALLRGVSPDTCLVCESNSARTVLEPGAFLVIRESGSSAIKDSSAAVLEHADRVLRFYGDRWDFPPDRCAFRDGRWSVPMEATAAVLAGGESRRMGRDKSRLPFRGRTLLEHIVDQIRPLTDEVTIGANDPNRYAFAGLPVVPDEQPGQGPLMGIVSCLQAARHERLLVTACDIPELPADFLRVLLRRAAVADIVMPRDSQGRYEPLLAVYTKRALPAARAVLARGGRRIVDILAEPGLKVDIVSLPPGDWYRNLNTPEDYRRIVHDGHL